MIAICSIDISEPVSQDTDSAELAAQVTAAGEVVTLDIEISELNTQKIQFEDSDL